jgi:hypothetical protein
MQSHLVAATRKIRSDSATTMTSAQDRDATERALLTTVHCWTRDRYVHSGYVPGEFVDSR